MEEEEDEDVVAEPLVITVEFLAKPWPDTISWYSDLGNGTRLAIEEEAGLEYVQGGLEAVGAEHSHQLATTLTITSLTHNLRQQNSTSTMSSDWSLWNNLGFCWDEEFFL